MTSTAAEARRALEGKQIWLWHYLHADWQWEQSRAWHEERYALAVEEVLDLMQTDPELTYFFDTASEFYEPVARLLGDRINELHDRVREGRIRIVSGQVANARPNLIAEETYIRNMQIGRRFFAENLPPTDLSLFHSVDIAIGHSQMPQLLKLAGFEMYRAWRPHGPMNVLGVPHQFVWQGLDGSEIVVTRGAYGGFYFDDHVPWDFETDWDGAVAKFFDHLLVDQTLHDRSASGQLWAIQGCDDCRPYRTWQSDRFFDLPKFVATWREKESAPITWCTPVEFSEAVAAQRDALPVVQGAIDGSDCSYNAAFSGTHGLWTWRVQNDRRLLRAERWAALAASLGAAEHADELTKLWAQHCVYQAHAEEAAFAEDFDALVDLAQEVRLASARIEAESLQAIALAAGGGDRLTRHVFNPHPWAVTADIDLYHALALPGSESLKFTDETGSSLSAQPLSDLRHPRYGGSLNDQHNLVRIELPPLGYRKIAIEESPEPANAIASTPGNEFTNGSLSFVFRDHALREIVDTESGHRTVSSDGHPIPDLIFHDVENANWLSAGPEASRSRFEPTESAWIESGPLRWVHRSTGKVGPYDATLDLVIPDHGRAIDVRVRLEGHWRVAPRTGWVSMMLPVPTDTAMSVDVPFGIETRDPDNQPYFGNVPEPNDFGIADMFERLRPGWFWGRSWADFSSAGHGVTVTGENGSFFWQKEATEAGPVLIRTLQLTPGTWEARCSPTQTGSGVHELTYRLRFHNGELLATDPIRRAAELHHQPVAVRANHPTSGSSGNNRSFVQLDGAATLSSLSREGGKQIVRIAQSTGGASDIQLTFDRPVLSAEVIDFTGAVRDAAITVSGNTLETNLRPWEIATFRVSLAESTK